MNPVVSLKNVSKTFRTSDLTVHALKNVSIDVNEGEIYGIIGLSGAGKSTLVRTINYLEVPDSGTIEVGQRIMGDLSKQELYKKRQKIGMIFQGFNLLSQRSIIQNICFPLEIAGIKKKEARRIAEETLALVGLSDKANAYPNQLSGGQQQRVAIARALANQPDVLLCDEATSALDPQTTDSILSLLKEINQRLKITMIVITHEMRVIEAICHRVAIVHHGEVVEEGNVSEIFQSPQSEMGKELIMPSKLKDYTLAPHQLRIVFDGQTTNEPIIANLVLEIGQPVNIIYADTKTLDGKMFGEMVIELPPDEAVQERMCRSLARHNIHYVREENHA